jgi:hypothetical protein
MYFPVVYRPIFNNHNFEVAGKDRKRGPRWCPSREQILTMNKYIKDSDGLFNIFIYINVFRLSQKNFENIAHKIGTTIERVKNYYQNHKNDFLPQKTVKKGCDIDDEIKTNGSSFPVFGFESPPPYVASSVWSNSKHSDDEDEIKELNFLKRCLSPGGFYPPSQGIYFYFFFFFICIIYIF